MVLVAGEGGGVKGSFVVTTDSGSRQPIPGYFRVAAPRSADRRNVGALSAKATAQLIFPLFTYVHDNFIVLRV